MIYETVQHPDPNTDRSVHVTPSILDVERPDEKYDYREEYARIDEAIMKSRIGIFEELNSDQSLYFRLKTDPLATLGIMLGEDSRRIPQSAHDLLSSGLYKQIRESTERLSPFSYHLALLAGLYVSQFCDPLTGKSLPDTHKITIPRAQMEALHQIIIERMFELNRKESGDLGLESDLDAMLIEINDELKGTNKKLAHWNPHAYKKGVQ